MHKSVLLEECIDNLNIKEDGIYIDGTVGYGGHSSEILKRIKKGFLFAFDKDSEAISFSNKRLSEISDNFEIIKSDFKYMKDELNDRKITEVDGILLDLGVSSPQLDEASRGFSYHNDARLDMRMNRDQELDAYKVVNEYTEEELTKIFYEYGDEKYSLKIARNICEYRKSKDIETTLELVEVIKSSVPDKEKKKKHPAKKVFQAIRIEVNGEIDSLKMVIREALELLKKDGRLCIITFHSLEDRIVKNIFKEYSEVSNELNKLPVIPDEYLPNYKLIGKFKPSDEEIKENARSRSSVLRVIERMR